MMTYISSWKIEAALTMIVAAIRWRRTFFGIGVSQVTEELIKDELSVFVFIISLKAKKKKKEEITI